MAKTNLKSLSDALADRLIKGALPGELQGFVKVGSDDRNFYLYRTNLRALGGAEAWEPEVKVEETKDSAPAEAVAPAPSNDEDVKIEDAPATTE